MLLNQITLVLNLTDSQLPNYFSHYNIRYLNPSWNQLVKDITLLQDICQLIKVND